VWWFVPLAAAVLVLARRRYRRGGGLARLAGALGIMAALYPLLCLMQLFRGCVPRASQSAAGITLSGLDLVALPFFVIALLLCSARLYTLDQRIVRAREVESAADASQREWRPFSRKHRVQRLRPPM
jgi:hypothetical protein